MSINSRPIAVQFGGLARLRAIVHCSEPLGFYCKSSSFIFGEMLEQDVSTI